MNCQKCKIEIEERDLRRESLSGAAESHLGICAGCRVFCEERLALRCLVGELEKFPAPADFDFRMRARMAAEMSARASRPGWFNFSPAALSWPLAGCLVLLLSISFYLQQRQSNAPATLTEKPIASSLTPKPKEAKPIVEQVTTVTQPRFSVIDPPIVKTGISPRHRVLPVQIGARMRVATPTGRERIEESNTAGLTDSAVKFAVTRATKSEMISVPLAAPERPLKVLLRDTSGGARMISVDSVSFGSRDVIGRSAVTLKNASLSSNQGVW